MIDVTLVKQAIHYIARANAQPALFTLKPEQARQLRKKVVQPTVFHTYVQTTSYNVTMRDGEQIELRAYRPHSEQALPVIVYYHGGGWVINDVNTVEQSCMELAAKTNHIVISVNYRLAPEYKFPIPLNDAFDSFLWVKQNMQQLRALDAISVAGDSAGGNLAIGVARLAAEQNLRVQQQILLYPVTDLNFTTASYKAYCKGFGLDRNVMQWFAQQYVSSIDEFQSPLVSPLRGDVAHTPRTFIVAAQYDVLHDEAVAYAEKLQQHQIDVELHEAKGLVHSYFTNNDLFATYISQTIEQINQFLQHKTH